MAHAVNLKKMTIEEKIQTMEKIWEDLCENSESLTSPSWHEKILFERAEKVKKEDEKIMDWEKAKKHIHNKTS